MFHLATFEAEFQKTINHAKMLARDGQVEEALRVINDLELRSAPYSEQLPPHIRYLIHFSRGKAYLQRNQTDLARAELELALELAESDAEAVARTQNLLGVVYFTTSQPALALQCHLISIQALSSGLVKEFNFQISVYQNLANAYWALNDLPHAIGAYKKALRLLNDVDSPDKQASVFWGLALSYKALGVYRYARLYMMRAIKVYQSLGKQDSEAAMHINMAEVLIEESMLTQAKQSLALAGALIEDTSNHGLLSFIHHYYADIARKEGDLPLAAQHARSAITHAEILFQDGQSDIEFWIDPLRTYAEALQGSALVQEAIGNSPHTDSLFQQAFGLLEQTSAQETRKMLHLNYAALLEARGDYKQAAHHYKQAAIRPPTSP